METGRLIGGICRMIRYSAHRWATVMAKARALLEENSVIRSDGVCRLNPEMARCVVGLVARNQKLNCLQHVFMGHKLCEG